MIPTPFHNPEQIHAQKGTRRLWAEFRDLVEKSYGYDRVRVTFGRLHGKREESGWLYIGKVRDVAERLGFDLGRVDA